MTKVFRVSCEFYVHAKDEDDVEQHLVDDTDFNGFIDKHISIEEVDDVDPEAIWEWE